jgi:hypothetical protein
MANDSKNSAGEEIVKKTPARGKSKEEASGGLTAVIIALVALIIIALSVGAFLLFVKVKKDYFEPLFKNRTENQVLPGGELTVGGSGSAPSALLPPIGTGDTTPVPVVPGEPTTPVPPVVPTDPTLPTTPEPPPVAPEPDKVGSYNFDAAIGGLDSTIRETYDTTFNNSIYSNDYFGFD